MITARRNRNHVGQTGGNGGLAVAVVSPADDRAADLERQTVIIARRNRHHVGRTGGNGGLAVGVISPADDRAVGLERHTMRTARRDCEQRSADGCWVNEGHVTFIGQGIGAVESEGRGPERLVGPVRHAKAVAGHTPIVIGHTRGQAGQRGVDSDLIRAAADTLGWSAVSVGKGGTPFKPGRGGQSLGIDRAVERGRVVEQIGRQQRADRGDDHGTGGGGLRAQRIGEAVSQHVSAGGIHIHRAGHHDGQIQVVQTSGNSGLAIIVESPADVRAVGLERQTVRIARRNRYHVGRTGWNSDLAVVVVSPTDDRAVGLERQTVKSARRNRHHIGQASGNRGLAVRVPSPTDDPAVRFERQTVITVRRNRHHVGRTGGNGDLAVVVRSPTDDRAVGLDRQTVHETRRHRHHVGRTGGNGGLAKTVVSPGDDRAVGLEC